MRPLATVALLMFLAGCDEPATTPEPDGGNVTFGVAIAAQDLAWEGQPRFVTVLRAESGDSLEGASVEVADPAGPLQIVEQRCADECAVVLRVLDRTANTGDAIPAPSAAAEALLNVLLPDAPPKQAQLRVMPLDTITADADTDPAALGGLRLASSATMDADVRFEGAPGAAPVRWIVFGDVTASGRIDVSAQGATPGPGGYGGGDAADDGRGPGGGGAGLDGAGGGGGGHGSEGLPGAGADDEPAGGGAGGFTDGTSCALDFSIAFGCGGSGGGGAEGEGGGGGGTLAIVSLGALDLSEAELRSVGGSGASGGGGGAGGAIALAAPELRLPRAAELAGGSGDGRGGEGGRGVFEVQAIEGIEDGVRAGPAVELERLSSITDRSSVTLHGRAAPDSLIIVERLDGESAQTIADFEGVFSVDVDLLPGLNRLRITQDGAIRSWVGTSIEIDQREGETPRLAGGLIDIAYLP